MIVNFWSQRLASKIVRTSVRTSKPTYFSVPKIGSYVYIVKTSKPRFSGPPSSQKLAQQIHFPSDVQGTYITFSSFLRVGCRIVTDMNPSLGGATPPSPLETGSTCGEDALKTSKKMTGKRYLSMYVCMYNVYINMCTCVYTCACTHGSTFVYVYACTCVCTCVCTAEQKNSSQSSLRN